MPRFAYTETVQDKEGNAIENAAVSVVLAGTSTTALIYDSYTGSSPVSSVTTGENGEFTFFVDDGDYSRHQRFDFIIVKSGYQTIQWNYIDIFPGNERTIRIGATDDQGDSDLVASLAWHVTDVGSNKKATVRFIHDEVDNTTAYDLTTNESVPANIFLEFEPGAVIDGSGTLTFDNPAQIKANRKTQIFGSSITVSFTYPGEVSAEWWGENTSPGSTDMYDELNAAKTSLTAGGSIKGNGESYVLGTDLTLGSTVYLEMLLVGSKIKPQAGITLTVYSPEHIIASPRQQIIDTTNNSSNPLVFTKKGQSYLPWFGAVFDGATDDTTALTCAINSNAVNVHAPGGTYAIQAEDISISGKDLILTGDGPGITTIDFEVLGGGTGLYSMTLQGSTTQIADLNAAVSMGDGTVDFASAHGLSVGDIFIIYNTTDTSFAIGSTSYRSGEFCMVESVTDSDTVVVTRNLFDDYDPVADTIEVYKLIPIRFEMRNLSITPRSNGYNPIIHNAKQIRINHIEMTGASKTFLSLSESYDIIVDDVTITATASSGQYNYGVYVGSGQYVTVKNMHANVWQGAHAFTSGTSGPITVPCRNMTIKNVLTNGSMSIHANAEFTQIEGCQVRAGISCGGGNGSMINNIVGWETYVGFVRDMNWRIIGNQFIAALDLTSTKYLFSTLDFLPTQMKRDSTFIFEGNTLDTNGFTGKAFEFGYHYVQTGDNVDMRVLIHNNTFNDTVDFKFDANDPLQMDMLSIKGNSFHGELFQIANLYTNILVFSDNMIDGCQIFIDAAAVYSIKLASIENNVGREMVKALYINGTETLSVKGNTLINTQSLIGSTVDKASLRLDTIHFASVFDNIFGDNRKNQKMVYSWTINDVKILYAGNNTTVGNHLGINITNSGQNFWARNPYGRFRESIENTIPPIVGTWETGDIVWKGNAAAESNPGWYVVTAGTQGTVTAKTADTLSGQAFITDLSNLTDLLVGQYIDVAGVTDLGTITKMIDAVASTTVDASSASGQAVLNVTATTNFAVGESIVIDRAGAGAGPEIGVIDSISDGVSLTLTSNLSGTYTNETVENIIVTSVAADATVDDAAVSWDAPTFKEFADLDA